MNKNLIKKLLICIICLLIIPIVFSNKSIAYTYSSRSALVNAKQKAVGNTVGFTTGVSSQVLGQFDPDDHMYCVKHNETSESGIYTIDAYIHIEGNKATGYYIDRTTKKLTKLEKTNYSNLGMVYLLHAEGYPKYYCHNGIRNMAVHHFYSLDWFPEVANPIALYADAWKTEYKIGWSQNSQADKDEAVGFVKRAREYADNLTDNACPEIKAANSEVEYSANYLGPFKVTYTGKIKSIKPVDASGNIVSGMKIRQSNKDVTDVSKIASDTDFYIQSNINIRKVIVELESRTVYTADIWFIEKSYTKSQQLITVEDGTTTISGVKAEITVKEPTGSLTINKKDSRTKDPIRVGFKIKNSSNKWLKGANGSFTYVNYVEDADTYYTNNGTIKLEKLRFDSYTVYEVEAGGGCALKYQDGYIKDKNYTRNKATTWERVECKKNGSSTLTIDINNMDISIEVLNIRGSLYIFKSDEENSGKQLEGAGFKIYYKEEGLWLKGTEYPFEYVSNINDATEYTTDNNNKSKYVEYIEYDSTNNNYKGKKMLKIMGLKVGTYHIYETKAPTGGYKLNLQNGYDAQKGYVDTGLERKVGEVKANGTATWNRLFDISNVQKISIAGYVWAEGRPEKPEDSSYDNVYINNSDHRVNNVTVKLFKKGNSNPIATAITDTNGYYKFTDVVKRTELANYYVEFDYREGKYSYTIDGNTINKTIKDSHGHIRYIPAAFKNVENGSKALSQTIPYEDVNTSSVAFTYKGTTANMINTYGLEKIGTMDDVNLVLNNINLGIKEMLEPKISVINNIADVKISINGYNYNYKYAGRDTEDTNFTDYTPEGPAVKWQNRNVSHAYSRPVYPSDVKYDETSTKKELDVKVTYRIDITNITTYNVKELYVENKLLLSKITDKFDSRRYMLEDTNWEADNGIATMKDGYLQGIQTKNGKKGINSQDTVTAHITFSVNRDAIIDILNHPDGIIENNPTEVTVEGYHEYYRDDYSWDNNIKKDGQQHKTENNEEKSEAPYLVFTIKPDGIKERTVSGKVFKDNVTAERGESGEVVGDGKYQESSEKGVSGVKVELLGEDMNVTKLYQAYTENDVVKTRVINAVVITDENGTYSINGVVPGKYYLRFTYGNGQYKITDLTGTTLKEGTYETKIQGSSDTISAGDYKSTIRNSGLVDLIRNKAELWYKENEFKTGKYSVALDEIGKRKAINEDTNIKEMNADSSKISVTIENTKSDEAQETPDSNNSIIQGKRLINDQNKNIKYNFDGFYFGLIEMPKARADIEKLITNVKIANAQGNVLYNGNPEKLNQGSGIIAVTDLDNKKNGGSSYVRAEMVETSIYGSSLELIYQVKVTNTSDVNYYTENYYLYGDKGDGSKEVTIIPTKVNDYLDKSLTYVEEESTKLNNNIKRINEGDKDKRIEIDEQEVRVQEFELTGWGKIYTNKIKNRDGSHPTSDSVNIFAKRILSKEDNDMEVVSYATITEVENSTSGDDGDEGIKLVRKAENVNANAKARFTLTPPTGNTADSLTYYAIAGIISLIVIAVGIVTIKKIII